MSSTVRATRNGVTIQVKTNASSMSVNYDIAAHELRKAGVEDATEDNISVAIW